MGRLTVCFPAHTQHEHFHLVLTSFQVIPSPLPVEQIPNCLVCLDAPLGFSHFLTLQHVSHCSSKQPMCHPFQITCVLSHFSRVQLFATLWTVALQVPASMGISRQEYWSGLPCPPPGDLPDPGIKPSSLMSPALTGRFFTTSTIWEIQITCRKSQIRKRDK